MTGALWSEIVDVNSEVNDAVKPMNDLDIYGKDEVWAYPATASATARTMCWRSAAS